jgi:UDP-N-acetylglucosamine acyltransferase
MSDLTVLREIADGASIHPDARIGPFCSIGPDVRIGPGTVLRRRVVVADHTRIGCDNVIEEGCVLGAKPQDLKYRGSATMLIIGDRNHFGRNVTAHIGTELGGGFTRIGSDAVLCAGSHVAHDCYVDDRAHLGPKVLLAGHVLVQTGAVIEELAGAHHFTTVGRFARVGKRTPVRRDVPPYTNFYSEDADSSPPSVRGIHQWGIERAGLNSFERRELRRALTELFEDEAALATKIEQLVNLGVEGEVAALCGFCQRSLQGVYGRYREFFRNEAPPEARELAEQLGLTRERKET